MSKLNLGPRRRAAKTAFEADLAEIRTMLHGEIHDIERNTCQKCGAPIRIMVFRGSGNCSQLCENAPF